MRGRQARALRAELERALVLHKQQQLDAAAKLYRRILDTAPDHADALQLLGAIEGQQGRFERSLELLHRAVASAPDSAIAHNNLGNALASMHRHQQALSAFERSLQLKPDNPKALCNRANALRKLNRLDEALASVERALELQPGYPEALVTRGELLQALRRPGEAVASFRAALAAGKDVATLHYVLASLGAEPTPDGAPLDYVKGLFDQYAGSFDHHLVEVLNYRTPQLLVDLLQRIAAPAPAVVADLGCGTGLCGPLLRPLATRLVGVDLSDRMLERARQAGHYDELVCSELVAWLAGAVPGFDIAVAADVLIYLGPLDRVFAGIARVLQPGGWFVFSVEAGGGDGYALQPNRRFAHSLPYVEAQAASHGLAVVAVEPAVLREDGNKPVDGLLVVLRRAAG